MSIFIIKFFFFPILIIISLVWFFTRKKNLGQFVGVMWAGLIGLYLVIFIVSLFFKKKELNRNDIYGEYIIDRTKFAGKQSDWQYNSFRFEITPQNEFLFHVTDKEKIIKTYRGKVEFLKAYKSPRIIFHVDTPAYHVIEDTPTLYRQVWSFYYVFNSPIFSNVFFVKGHWVSIDTP